MTDTDASVSAVAEYPLPDNGWADLDNRVVVCVSGPGTDKFLQGQFSQNLNEVIPEYSPRAAAALEPQRATARPEPCVQPTAQLRGRATPPSADPPRQRVQRRDTSVAESTVSDLAARPQWPPRSTQRTQAWMAFVWNLLLAPRAVLASAVHLRSTTLHHEGTDCGIQPRRAFH